MAAVMPIYEPKNTRLRRELAEAKMDNEFLSKATAFFAAKQRDRKNLS